MEEKKQEQEVESVVFNVEDEAEMLCNHIKKCKVMFAYYDLEHNSIGVSREFVSIYPQLEKGLISAIGANTAHQAHEVSKTVVEKGEPHLYEFDFVSNGKLVHLLCMGAAVTPQKQVSLGLDITEYKNNLLAANNLENERLRLARDISEKSNEIKRTFLAGMSHEIRTPLNGIIGNLDLMSKEPLSKTQLESLNDIKTNAGHLMSIINDLLDIGRLDRGQVNFERVDFDISQIVSDIYTLHGPMAHQKGLTLNVDLHLDQEKQFIFDDYSRIMQVLSNLVSNAIKFTFNGSIMINIRYIGAIEYHHWKVGHVGHKGRPFPNNGVIFYMVTDTGIGMGQNDLYKIFEPFTTIEAGTRTRFQGTGLGLAIVASLVDQLEGDYGVTSEKYAGSTFWFWTPYRKGNPLKVSTSISWKGKAKAKQHIPWHAFTPSHEQSSKVRELLRSDGSDGSDAGASSSSFSKINENVYRPTVLIAEDNTMAQKMYVRMVQFLGYDAIGVNNGYELVQMLGMYPERFKLCLVDLRMPIMDGHDAARQIRQLQGNIKNIPLIAMTAHAVPGELEKCKESGFNDFMAKPFTSDVLEEYLQAWIQ